MIVACHDGFGAHQRPSIPFRFNADLRAEFESPEAQPTHKHGKTQALFLLSFLSLLGFSTAPLCKPFSMSLLLRSDFDEILSPLHKFILGSVSLCEKGRDYGKLCIVCKLRVGILIVFYLDE